MDLPFPRDRRPHAPNRRRCLRMRRLAARRLGGPEGTKPATGRHRVAVLAGGLVAVLLLVTGTAVLWSRDRPAAPASVQAPPAIRTPADPAALQRQLDGVVETGTPGVVALVRSGQQTWQGASGLGDLHAKRPARAGDRFRIGSVTKSFVATVALQLVGEDKLGLDDHLERWLPGLVPNGDDITVRQLLNHTSGLYDYTDDLPEPRPTLPATGAGRHRHRPSAAVRARETVLLQQHQLHPGRPGHRAGHRPAAGRPAPAAHLGQPLDLGDTELPVTEQALASPYVHGYAPREKGWRVTDGPAGLLDVTKMEPFMGVGGRRDGVQHRRPGPFLPGPARRPAARPRAAAGNADHRGRKPAVRTRSPLRPWPDAATAGMRDRTLGPRRSARGLQDDRLQHQGRRPPARRHDEPEP